MNKILVVSVVFLLPVLFCRSSHADSLDLASEEALAKTQQLLKSPELRKEAMSEGPNRAAPQQADQAVRDLSGNSDAKTDEIYKLSGSLFSNLTKKSGGDPKKMQELLNEASQNPEKFAEQMSVKDKAELTRISAGLNQNK